MGQQHYTVLVVDDDASIRRLFRALLSRTYAVREAASGEEAVEIISSWSPELVLLDIMMPGIDGYETCRRLKALPTEQSPQVIMVSGKSAPAEQARAFEVGADDYMIKPVDPAELRSRVELHFRLRESQTTTAVLQQEVDRHRAALSERPYKEAWSSARAKQTIDEAAGTQFDPVVVAAMSFLEYDLLQSV